MRYPFWTNLPRQYLHLSFWPTWLLLLFLWLLRSIPHHWRRGLGRTLGRFLFFKNQKRVAIVKTNLEWTHPDKTAAERSEILSQFAAYSGQTMLEFSHLWWSSPRSFTQQIEFIGGEWVDSLQQQGRPIIFLTGHPLALDVAGMAISQRWPMITYSNKARNPLIQHMMSWGRCRFDVELLERESGLRPLLRSLKQGRILYYVIDEDLGLKHSVFAPFFGINKATLTSPARIAQMSGAAVASCYSWFDRESQRYKIWISEPAENFPQGDPVADAARVNQLLQQGIEQAPEQYLWTQRLFQTRPEGVCAPYTMNGYPQTGPRAPTDIDRAKD